MRYFLSWELPFDRRENFHERLGFGDVFLSCKAADHVLKSRFQDTFKDDVSMVFFTWPFLRRKKLMMPSGKWTPFFVRISKRRHNGVYTAIVLIRPESREVSGQTLLNLSSCLEIWRHESSVLRALRQMKKRLSDGNFCFQGQSKGRGSWPGWKWSKKWKESYSAFPTVRRGCNDGMTKDNSIVVFCKSGNFKGYAPLFAFSEKLSSRNPQVSLGAIRRFSHTI